MVVIEVCGEPFRPPADSLDTPPSEGAAEALCCHRLDDFGPVHAYALDDEAGDRIVETTRYGFGFRKFRHSDQEVSRSISR
jgi:hypothetical protein